MRTQKLKSLKGYHDSLFWPLSNTPPILLYEWCGTCSQFPLLASFQVFLGNPLDQIVKFLLNCNPLTLVLNWPGIYSSFILFRLATCCFNNCISTTYSIILKYMENNETLSWEIFKQSLDCYISRRALIQFSSEDRLTCLYSSFQTWYYIVLPMLLHTWKHGIIKTLKFSYS